MSKLPVSVHILTFNSEKTLPGALASVAACAEILVIDGGSSDRTLEIAASAGARVIPQRDAGQGRRLTDFSAARNRGLREATEPWILSLDSDEIASPELMEELRMIVTEGIPCACLVPRRYVLPDGTLIRYATTYPNERFYFFHRDTAKEWIKPVHERPELKPNTNIRHLKGASLAPLGTLAEYKEKNLRYIAIEREKSKKETFGSWFMHRFLRTLRSRLIGLVKLLWIWVIPRPGNRLPLRFELMRFWYGWKLIVATFPKRSA